MQQKILHHVCIFNFPCFKQSAVRICCDLVNWLWKAAQQPYLNIPISSFSIKNMTRSVSSIPIRNSNSFNQSRVFAIKINWVSTWLTLCRNRCCAKQVYDELCSDCSTEEKIQALSLSVSTHHSPKEKEGTDHCKRVEVSMFRYIVALTEYADTVVLH